MSKIREGNAIISDSSPDKEDWDRQQQADNNIFRPDMHCHCLVVEGASVEGPRENNGRASYAFLLKTAAETKSLQPEKPLMCSKSQKNK